MLKVTHGYMMGSSLVEPSVSESERAVTWTEGWPRIVYDFGVPAEFTVW